MGIDSLVPEIGRRFLIVGKTGSGKSTLAKQVLSRVNQHIVIIDPKGTFEFGGTVVENPDELGGITDEVIIYKPAPEYLNVDDYNRVLTWVYNRSNCCLYIDELYGLADKITYPPYLRALYTRGRERKITIIACSQRPSQIPLYTISESEYVAAYELKIIDDRKRLAGIMGEEFLVKAEGHSFWFASDFADNVQYMRVNI